MHALLSVVWDARRKLKGFISYDPVTDEQALSPETSCHSLRTVWEKLDMDFQIGTIQIGEHSKEHISPMSEESKEILNALGAKATPRRIERLHLVG